MTKTHPIRPDRIDKTILARARQTPQGIVVPDLYEILPTLRENTIRYRVKTLENIGLLRCERILGRVIIYPTADAEVTA